MLRTCGAWLSRAAGALFLVSLVGAGCAVDEGKLPSGAGGDAGAAATSGGSGGVAGANVGGTSMAGSSGVSTGGGAGALGGTGAGGSAGGSGTGATSAGGGAGGAGSGGAAGSQAGGGSGAGGAGAAGGASGRGGAGGMGGAASMPVPSEGCGKGGRPSSTSVPNTIVSFPQSYDGTRPMPLVFGLHGAGRTNDQFRTVDARTQGTALETHFVMAYVKSAGSGWVVNTDRARIDTAYTQITTNYCIDTSRVFATGHSSGAQMIVQLLCAGESRLRAVAPVASSAYCSSWMNSLPVLLIHGTNDMERASTNQDADGRKDLAPYLASSGCDMTTTPYDVAGCSSGGTQVNPGCVSYQGCDDEMIWCHHNDPNYSNTNHGWPCFANTAMDAFFSRQ